MRRFYICAHEDKDLTYCLKIFEMKESLIQSSFLTNLHSIHFPLPCLFFFRAHIIIYVYILCDLSHFGHSANVRSFLSLEVRSGKLGGGGPSPTTSPPGDVLNGSKSYQMCKWSQKQSYSPFLTPGKSISLPLPERAMDMTC